MFSVLIILV